MAGPVGPRKFDAIIIDPDSASRMRLKQACGAVHQFGRVFPVASITEGLQKLQTDQNIDVVFVSYRCSTEQISHLIREGKSTPGGQDSAYIFLLKNTENDTGATAQSMMLGADGALMEPYSVDFLVEITTLSAKIRLERTEAREEAAVKLLMKDVIQQLDVIAYSKSCGYEAGPAWRSFKQSCQILGTLDGDKLERYYRVAIEVFEAAPLPQALYTRAKYVGASSRVKKRMVEKLTADAEKASSS